MWAARTAYALTIRFRADSPDPNGSGSALARTPISHDAFWRCPWFGMGIARRQQRVSTASAKRTRSPAAGLLAARALRPRTTTVRSPPISSAKSVRRKTRALVSSCPGVSHRRCEASCRDQCHGQSWRPRCPEPSSRLRGPTGATVTPQPVENIWQ